MQVYVDDLPVPVRDSTLAGALAAARSAAEVRGRVIVEATLDGVAIPDELLASPTADEFVGSDVRFATADPGMLVGSTLRGLGEALIESKLTHTRAGELIQRGEIKEGVESLGEALNIWEQVRQGIHNGSALLGLSIESLTIPATDSRPATEIAPKVQELAGRLSEIKRAFIAQDWSALADALNYDLPEQADQWSATLVALAEHLEAGSPA
jgi:hypothetical protein